MNIAQNSVRFTGARGARLRPGSSGRLRLSRWRTVFGCVAVVLWMLPAGAAPGAATAPAGADASWGSGSEYVRVVPQDGSALTGTAPNDHPAALSSDVLRRMLSAVRVRQPGLPEPQPVFDAGQLDVLSRALAGALGRADDREDVVFSVSGLAWVLFKPEPQRRVTSGRLFYKAGKLNIIFSAIHAKPTSRGGPQTEPGSRAEAASHAWMVAAGPGVGLAIGAGGERLDWVIVDPSVEPPAAPVSASVPRDTTPEPDRLELDAPASNSTAPPPTSTVAAAAAAAPAGTAPGTSAEHRQLMRELAELRQALQATGTESPAAAPAVVEPPPPDPAKALKAIEARLFTLREMRQMEMISEPEYEAVRRQILKDL